MVRIPNYLQILVLRISFFLLFVIACSDDYILSRKVPTEQVTEEPLKLNLLHHAAHIGYNVMITGYDFDTVKSYVEVIFEDSLITYPNFTRSDTIAVYVPYGAKSGNLKVYGGSKLIGITDILTITEDYSEGVHILSWNLNYSIDEDDGLFDGGVGFYSRWLSQVKQDTLYLKQKGSGPNVSWDKTICFTYDLEQNLPELIYGKYILYSISYHTFNFDEVVIKIQDWDLQSIVSGKLFYPHTTHYAASDVFWVNLDSTQ